MKCQIRYTSVGILYPQGLGIGKLAKRVRLLLSCHSDQVFSAHFHNQSLETRKRSNHLYARQNGHRHQRYLFDSPLRIKHWGCWPVGPGMIESPSC